MDLVVSQNRVAVCFDPDACHGIVKDLIIFNKTKTTVVHQNTTILASPNFVFPDQRIAASSAQKKIFCEEH